MKQRPDYQLVNINLAHRFIHEGESSVSTEETRVEWSISTLITPVDCVSTVGSHFR